MRIEVFFNKILRKVISLMTKSGKLLSHFVNEKPVTCTVLRGLKII